MVFDLQVTIARPVETHGINAITIFVPAFTKTVSYTVC